MLAAAVLGLLTSCSQAPPPDALAEGRPFPILALTGLDGGQVALDDFRGRLVVLNVWATWCAPCRRELPSLERLAGKLDPARFSIIGLSVDRDIDFARDYLREHGIGLTSYIDPGGALAEGRLGIRVYPDTFVISPTGTLLRRIVGERDWDDPAMAEILEAAYRGDTARLRDV